MKWIVIIIQEEHILASLICLTQREFLQAFVKSVAGLPTFRIIDLIP